MSEKLISRRKFMGLIGVASMGVIAGCSSQPTKYYFNPYVGVDPQAPQLKYCFDTIGHKQGALPFALGGTCCCTPSDHLLEAYHQDGLLMEYTSVEQLERLYTDQGIVLRHDHGWSCNNLCDQGPHVVFGGKCMAPPVVGTQNFVNVAAGKKPVL